MSKIPQLNQAIAREPQWPTIGIPIRELLRCDHEIKA